MRSYIHFLPQAHFLTDDKGTIPLDFIGRFENLSRDYKTIVSKLGIDRVIEQQNQSERAVNYEGYYSQALREKVAKLYSDDFDLLGYFK
jgi:hypothetical protein